MCLFRARACLCQGERKKIACMCILSLQQYLDKRHCMIDTAFCSLISIWFLIWHQDIRARRVWVHKMIHRRQHVVKIIPLAMKKKSSISSPFLKSWEIFKWRQNKKSLKKEAGCCAFSLGGCLLPQLLAHHWEQLKKMLSLRRGLQKL